MKKYLLLGLAASLMLFAPVLAQTDAPVSNLGAIAIVAADAATPSLDGITVEESTKVPSGLGLWWRGVKERVSLLTTTDPVKKAEKQLQFAEERMQIAKTIAEKSADPKIQARAEEMLKKANEYMQKIEDKKADWMEKKDEAADRLLKNIATHEIRREQIMDKIEAKIPEARLEKIREEGQKALEQGKRLLNAVNNEKLPAEVRAHLEDVKTRIETNIQEVKDFRDQAEALREKAADGDESAKAGLESLRVERLNMVKERVAERAEDRQDIKDAVEQVREVKKDQLEVKREEVKQLLETKRETEKQRLEKLKLDDNTSEENRLDAESEKRIQKRAQELKEATLNPVKALREAERIKQKADEKRLEVEKNIKEMEQEN